MEVRFTTRPFDPQGNSPIYPMDGSLGGILDSLEAVVKRKISLLAPTGNGQKVPDSYHEYHQL